MAHISSMTLRQCNVANEERSSYFPQASLVNQTRSAAATTNVRAAYGQGQSASPLKKLRADDQNDNIFSVRGRDSTNGQHKKPLSSLKSSRLAKQWSKQVSTLKSLKSGASISGFIDPKDSQYALLDDLYEEGSETAAANLPVISAS